MRPDIQYAPRGLKREEAARYVGVSPSKFDQMVKDGRMPPPREIDSCRVWDRVLLDAAFEELPVRGDAVPNPFDGIAA
jgi:predicted DNA-binding transcriptional regulator AlpA